MLPEVRPAGMRRFDFSTPTAVRIGVQRMTAYGGRCGRRASRTWSRFSKPVETAGAAGAPTAKSRFRPKGDISSYAAAASPSSPSRRSYVTGTPAEVGMEGRGAPERRPASGIMLSALASALPDRVPVSPTSSSAATMRR
jgi:hypothetical protein